MTIGGPIGLTDSGSLIDAIVILVVGRLGVRFRSLPT